MSQNSVSAYHNLNRHQVSSQIGKIYTLIRDSDIPLHDRQIAQLTGYDRSTVESRVSQLEKEDAIKRVDRFDYKTRNWSRAWEAKMP